MSQMLPTYNFEWVEDISQFSEVFIKNYDEKSELDDILEIDVKHPEDIYELHGDLPFLSERKKLETVEKLATNLQDKTEYVTHIRNLKEALHHGLVLKSVHRAISFNQDERLKPYIKLNSKLRAEAKNEFKKDFLKLMNNTVFGKTMENQRKYRDIKLVTTEKKTNYLVSDPNYYTTKLFTKNLLAIEMNKRQITMNKPVYLELAILDISKIAMYEFWFDYIKLKFSERVKLCYIDTDSFIAHKKTEDVYKDISEDVEKRFETSNYEVDRPLLMGKNKKKLLV